MLCPKCGNHPSPEDKFCMECGSPKALFVDDSVPPAQVISQPKPEPLQEVPQQPVVATPRPVEPTAQQAPPEPPVPISQPQYVPPPAPPTQPQGPPAYAPQQYQQPVQPAYQQPYQPARPVAPPQYQQPYPPQAQPLPQMIPYQRSSNEMTPSGNSQIGQYQVYVPPKAPKADIQIPATPVPPVQAPPVPAPQPAQQPYQPYSQPQPPQAPPVPQSQPAQQPYQPAPPAAPANQPGPWASQQPPSPPNQPQPVPNTYRPYPPSAQQPSNAPPYPAPQPQYQQPYQQPYQPAPPAAPQPYAPQPTGSPPGMVMLMPQVASAAMLRPNERAVQVWRAGLEQSQYDPEEGTQGTFNISGVLIATDQRLIFVQEKGVFGKSYKPLDSVDYREIINWKLGQTMRMKSLQVDVAQGRDRRKVFNNLCEADPMTLSHLTPWTLDQVKDLLGRLKSAAP